VGRASRHLEAQGRADVVLDEAGKDEEPYEDHCKQDSQAYLNEPHASCRLEEVGSDGIREGAFGTGVVGQEERLAVAPELRRSWHTASLQAEEEAEQSEY
jgi:hypothetical protein